MLWHGWVPLGGACPRATVREGQGPKELPSHTHTKRMRTQKWWFINKKLFFFFTNLKKRHYLISNSSSLKKKRVWCSPELRSGCKHMTLTEAGLSSGFFGSGADLESLSFLPSFLQRHEHRPPSQQHHWDKCRSFRYPNCNRNFSLFSGRHLGKQRISSQSPLHLASKDPK